MFSKRGAYLFLFALLSLLTTSCVGFKGSPSPPLVAECRDSFQTEAKFCNTRRVVSNKVQDGSLIAVRSPTGKVIKVAAYYNRKWDLCFPKTYNRFFKEGEPLWVEVLRCGYSQNKPYCPWRVKYSKASWYGYGDGSGKWTASGRPFIPESYGLANRELPFGTLVKITNLENGKSVYAVVLDRGPYVKGRDFDLYPKTMRALGGLERGVIPVKVEVIRCGWEVD